VLVRKKPERGGSDEASEADPTGDATGPARRPRAGAAFRMLDRFRLRLVARVRACS